MERIALRLLATTDLHGHYLDFDYYKDEPIPNFGLIALAGLIEEARAENPNTLLFDNGDLLQGCPLADYLREYALKEPHPAYLLMNQLRYDCATLGNHEFNFGLPFLEKMMLQADFPYVCANLAYESGEPWIEPYHLLKREVKSESGEIYPLTIGVIGFLPPQVLTWDKQHFDLYAKEQGRLVTDDILATAARYLPKMKREGADLIVALAHSGYSVKPYEVGAENSALYLTTLDGIDVVVAGHQHQRFPFAQFIHQEDPRFNLDLGLINGKASVMAGSWSRYLGVIDLTLSVVEKREGYHFEILDQCASLRSLDGLPNDFSVNPQHRALLEPAHQEARRAMNVPIGYSESRFYSYLSLIQDDNCIQVVADAHISIAKERLDALKHPDRDLPILGAVPLFKVGGRKDDPTYYTEIERGEISFKDVADLYVYPNQLVVLKIDGRNLREWLECCVSIYHTIDPTEQNPQPLINWDKYRSYNVDIIKGVEYTIDLTQPPRYDGKLHLINELAHRIERLTYRGKAVKDDDLFLLSTNSYRALVDRFPGAGRENAILVTMEEIPDVIRAHVERELQEHSLLKVRPNYNWRFNEEKISGLPLLVEMSNRPQLPAYLLEHFPHSAEYRYTDREGFHIYQIIYR